MNIAMHSLQAEKHIMEIDRNYQDLYVRTFSQILALNMYLEKN